MEDHDYASNYENTNNALRERFGSPEKQGANFSDTLSELYSEKYVGSGIAKLKAVCAEEKLPECLVFGSPYQDSSKDPTSRWDDGSKPKGKPTTGDGTHIHPDGKPKPEGKPEGKPLKPEDKPLSEGKPIKKDFDEYGLKSKDGKHFKPEYKQLDKPIKKDFSEYGLKGKPDVSTTKKPELGTDSSKPGKTESSSIKKPDLDKSNVKPEIKPLKKHDGAMNVPPPAWEGKPQIKKPDSQNDSLAHKTEKMPIKKPEGDPYMAVIKTPEGKLIKKPLDINDFKKKLK